MPLRILLGANVPPESWPCHPSTLRLVTFAAAAIPPNCPPCADGPQGPGTLLLAAARGSRAGERLQEEGRGRCPQDPLIARAISAAAFRIQPWCKRLTVVPYLNRVSQKSPVGRSRAHGRASRVCVPALGSPLTRLRGAQSLRQMVSP